MSENRYVRVWCPVCEARSPVCDQQEDIRRLGPMEWWDHHVKNHTPLPKWEVAPSNDGSNI